MQAEVDTESIGTVLCRKAESLHAAAIIVSCEARSRLQEFFLGSITNFCTCAACPASHTPMALHHAKLPLCATGMLPGHWSPVGQCRTLGPSSADPSMYHVV